MKSKIADEKKIRKLVGNVLNFLYDNIFCRFIRK